MVVCKYAHVITSRPALRKMLACTGSAGAAVALRLLKERADSAEARAAAALRQVAELKASLQVKALRTCGFTIHTDCLPTCVISSVDQVTQRESVG